MPKFRVTVPQMGGETFVVEAPDAEEARKWAANDWEANNISDRMLRDSLDVVPVKRKTSRRRKVERA